MIADEDDEDDEDGEDDDNVEDDANDDSRSGARRRERNGSNRLASLGLEGRASRLTPSPSPSPSQWPAIIPPWWEYVSNEQLMNVVGFCHRHISSGNFPPLMKLGILVNTDL